MSRGVSLAGLASLMACSMLACDPSDLHPGRCGYLSCTLRIKVLCVSKEQVDNTEVDFFRDCASYCRVRCQRRDDDVYV